MLRSSLVNSPPRQVHERLQVGELHVVVGALGVELVQLLHLLVEVALHVVGPLLLPGLLREGFLLRCALVAANLCLHVLDLLLQEVVALLGVEVVARLVAYVELQVFQRQLAVEEAQGGEEAFLHGGHLQQLLLLGVGEGHVAAHEVEGHHVVLHVAHGEGGLVGYLFVLLDVFGAEAAKVARCGGELGVVRRGQLLGEGLHGGREVGLGALDAHQLHPAQALSDGRDGTAGQHEHLHHARIDAVVEQVLARGLVHRGLPLAHHAHDAPRLLHLLDELHARLAANDDGRDHAGEEHEVPHGEYGHAFGHFLVGELAEIALDVGNHGKSAVVYVVVHWGGDPGRISGVSLLVSLCNLACKVTHFVRLGVALRG